jgi:hypothetical protein
MNGTHPQPGGTLVAVAEAFEAEAVAGIASFEGTGAALVATL